MSENKILSGITQKKFLNKFYLVGKTFVLTLNYKNYNSNWSWESGEAYKSLNYVKIGKHLILMPFGISMNFCRFLLVNWFT